MWREPIEILVAIGHGRSFGQDSAVLGRKISGIFPCALWQNLQNRVPLPTTALVTDIGNDLLYGAPPDRLLEWVECCLDRLAEAGATTVITQLPVLNIERLSERRFQIFRRVLFPRSTLTLGDAKRLVRELNEGLIAIGGARKISAIPVSPAWYGLDPIHIMRRAQREAWPAFFAHWDPTQEQLGFPRPSLLMAAYLASLAPLEWSQFGFARRHAQPCAGFSDGTTISLY